ncbi:hypothetical protein DIS24_g5138 [Lasiodiplodia hormozganensis]|uniref:Uncharacterized protein n=1 Tax=Lasiodiplodia hormozganensis TaxID=869390 RepID=A0AA39YN30_9PEZI|nr:hypothetical protein DIS24_g5138 [Lasiodiplodia hormozganensis]
MIHGPRCMIFHAELLPMTRGQAPTVSDPFAAKVPTALESFLEYISKCCHVPCVKDTARPEHSPVRITVSANRILIPSEEQQEEGEENGSDVVEMTAVVDPHADTSGPARAHNIIRAHDLGRLASCVKWFDDVVVVDGLKVRGEIVLKCRPGSASSVSAGKSPVRTMWEWKFLVVETEEGAGKESPEEVPMTLSSDALQKIFDEGGWQQQARPAVESRKSNGCVPKYGELSKETWEDRERRARREDEEIARREKEKRKVKASQNGPQEGSSGSKKNGDEEDKKSNKSTDQKKKTDASGREGDSDKENNNEEAGQGRT